MDLQGALYSLQEFLERGGPVLPWIMVLTFVMWTFLLERFAYFAFAHKGIAQRARQEWADRKDHHSWYAHAIRDQLISEVKIKTSNNVEIIKTLVAMAPLFGLLGTVTGMVSVFDTMAISGSSDARGMAAGVARATIPTMAGMVTALSGLFFSNQIESMSQRRVHELSDQLEVD